MGQIIKFLMWLFFWPLLLPIYLFKKIEKSLNTSEIIKKGAALTDKMDNKLKNYDQQLVDKEYEKYKKDNNLEVNTNDDLYNY